MSKHEDGVLTVMAKNNIKDFNKNMTNVDINEQFFNGIVKRIEELGYAGKKVNRWQAVDIICDKFKEHNIKMTKNQKDNTRININNWLLKNAPNDSDQSRLNVYKLCFALEMNADETEIFFLKNYLCRPFNFKNFKECIYYFCLNTGRNYMDAERLILEVESLYVESNTEDKETRLIGIELSEIVEETDFLNYIKKNIYSESSQRKTVISKIMELMDNCKIIANVESDSALLKAIYYDEHKNIGNKFLGRQKLLDNERFPKFISRNFPNDMSLSKIRRIKDDTKPQKKIMVTDDICRKLLILLYFYKFYEHDCKKKRDTKDISNDFSLLYSEFEIALDNLLYECGFVQLYSRNPYDRFFLSCAKNQNPLLEFRRMIY